MGFVYIIRSKSSKTDFMIEKGGTIEWTQQPHLATIYTTKPKTVCCGSTVVRVKFTGVVLEHRMNVDKIRFRNMPGCKILQVKENKFAQMFDHNAFSIVFEDQDGLILFVQCTKYGVNCNICDSDSDYDIILKNH